MRAWRRSSGSVGAALTLNVLGCEVEVVVANLREIDDWWSAGTNLTPIAAPGVFDGAPHGLIGTVCARPESEGFFLTALAALVALAGPLEGALSTVAALAPAVVLPVVAAATAAMREARLRDVVVLRALGTPAWALRRAPLVKFAAVGLVAGFLAALVGALFFWPPWRSFSSTSPGYPLPGRSWPPWPPA
jgi:predicted lysophospholipase L1 biosynthesis ABC-type transport system permease subunit